MCGSGQQSIHRSPLLFSVCPLGSWPVVGLPFLSDKFPALKTNKQIKEDGYKCIKIFCHGKQTILQLCSNMENSSSFRIKNSLQAHKICRRGIVERIAHLKGVDNSTIGPFFDKSQTYKTKYVPSEQQKRQATFSDIVLDFPLWLTT